MQTNDAEVNKLIEMINAGNPVELMSRDNLRKIYRKLDCRLLHGIPADDCSKIELINGVKQKLGLFEKTSNQPPVSADDALTIPESLRRVATPETAKRLDEIVKEVSGKGPVPKMPSTAVARSYAKSNIETGTKMQKWFFKSDKGADELPKQAQQILSVVRELGDKGVDRDAISNTLRGVIKTKQPIDRVVSFYRARLVSGGFVKIV